MALLVLIKVCKSHSTSTLSITAIPNHQRAKRVMRLKLLLASGTVWRIGLAGMSWRRGLAVRLLALALLVVAVTFRVDVSPFSSAASATAFVPPIRRHIRTAAPNDSNAIDGPVIIRRALFRQKDLGYAGIPVLRSSLSNEDASTSRTSTTPSQPPFSLPTALFLAGLAFDAYVEPPQDSSRWERGSTGTNVAFLSTAYTRSLYKGIIEVTPIRASDLPDEDDAAESMLSGGGVDATLLVSVVEGAWKEDIEKLEREVRVMNIRCTKPESCCLMSRSSIKQYHNGVLDLAGCAHVGRSSTAWSNVDENKAKRNKQRGESGAYHVKSTWGKGGQAVWEGDPPFYLYVQDPV